MMTENRAVAINTESCFRDIVQKTVVESKASEPFPQRLTSAHSIMQCVKAIPLKS
jgi:hypothetical protein